MTFDLEVTFDLNATFDLELTFELTVFDIEFYYTMLQAAIDFFHGICMSRHVCDDSSCWLFFSDWLLFLETDVIIDFFHGFVVVECMSRHVCDDSSHWWLYLIGSYFRC